MNINHEKQISDFISSRHERRKISLFKLSKESAILQPGDISAYFL